MLSVAFCFPSPQLSTRRTALVFACAVSPLLVLGGGAVLAKEAPPPGTVTYSTGYTYQHYENKRQSFPPVQDLRNWGEHPIVWKHLRTEAELGFDPVDPSGIGTFVDLPFLEVDIGDAVDLNQFEASGAFFDATGPVDPAGEWLEITSEDGEQVAIFAAMVIWKWGSPVYVPYLAFFDSGSFSAVGAIDEVTLSHPSGPPHVVCGWSDPDPNASCPGLTIDSVKMTYYSDLVSVKTAASVIEYFDEPAVSGQSFVETYEQSTIPGLRSVVYDPPTGAHWDAFRLELASAAQARDVGVREGAKP